jgi:hypothetical protein
MNQEIISNLGLTEQQLTAAMDHIKHGEGLYVVAAELGLDHLTTKEQDRLINQLGIFLEAQR